MSHVTRSLFAACWWAVCSLVAPVCVASTISPYATAFGTPTAPGTTMWGIVDQTGRIVGGPQTTTPVSVSSGGALTVQTAAKVPTKHGAVDAVIKREIPYSKLAAPWKKALRVVPLVATGLAVVEILGESCIQPTGVGMFEKCFTGDEVETAYEVGYYEGSSSPPANQLIDEAQALTKARQRLSELYTTTRNVKCAVSSTSTVAFQDSTRHGLALCTAEYLVTGTSNTWSGTEFGFRPAPRCPSGDLQVQSTGGYWPRMFCLHAPVAGYNPVGPEVAESALNNPPSGSPDHVRDKVFKLWKELADLPDGAPADARSVDATGLSAPTVTPKTPADTSKAGPKTSETTANGTKVTQETATITYQGDRTTVTNNTTVTNINNEGNVVNESTTTEESQTDCEKNPSAVSCAELGDPPDAEIPRSEKSWEITPESLPGGSCPGGFVFPIPGQPEFSWQPLCDRLPAVRAVILVLASVLAAWIVAGGFNA